jgi:hypothetical protein
LIRAAIERNCVRNVELHQVALGEMSGTLTLHVPSGNAGAASVLPSQHRNVTAVAVPVARLSDVLNNQPRIRFIKIDVEGFEAEVLRGATELFRWVPPDAILDGLGYDFFALPKALLRVRLGRADPRQETPRGVHDFLAVYRKAAVHV